MNLFWTSISFWMSLLTNIVVYCGVLSFFYWICGNMADRFVMQHPRLLEHALVISLRTTSWRVPQKCALAQEHMFDILSLPLRRC